MNGHRSKYANGILAKAGLPFLIGKSPVFRAALKNLPAIAAASDSVLITGDTGAGKELCARAIHQLGSRAGQAFVAVNCATLTPELAANDLFGHVAGGYTSAALPGEGFVKAADGGILFLDELNSLPMAVQGKLLRFFDERQFDPIGSAKVVTVDVRVVAATNVDLEKCVAEGRFRGDLYHRLQQLPIHLPPLRMRREDIILLAEHFLREISIERGTPLNSLTSQAAEKLLACAWPGNVRELRNVIRRAATVCPVERIDASDIDLNVPASLAPPQTRQQALDFADRQYLMHVLAKHNGNIRKAAQEADAARANFYECLSRHGISIADFRESRAAREMPDGLLRA
jgi:two-component system, NtrC family, response regulator GlrR